MEGAPTAGGGDGMQGLPEGCVANILALTTPRDACRSAAVSWTFRSAADSDAVWDRFLPPDHGEILSRAATPVAYSSKRELYFRLCTPIPIDGGRKSFALERSSGKKSFMLSARELAIVWGDTPDYWEWISHPESRFSEVAELKQVCWLEIRGSFPSRVLSHDTRHAALLVFKLTEDSSGLAVRHETSVRIGAHTSEGAVVLDARERSDPRWPGPTRPRRRFPRSLLQPAPPLVPPADTEQGRRPEMPPRARSDGWLEIKLGEFLNEGGDDGDVEMSFTEIKGGHWKQGLVLEGIELRPC